MIITVAITTVVWLAVTFMTKPESDATLVRLLQAYGPIRYRLEANRSDGARSSPQAGWNVQLYSIGYVGVF